MVILKMTVSISCCLCFSFVLTFKCLADDKGQFNNIYEIAIKYFKPELSTNKEKRCSAVICLKCWNHIDKFYSFQQLIRSTQSQMKKRIPVIRIYRLENKLNSESAPTQPLYFASSSQDHDNPEIQTSKVDFAVSPTPIDIKKNVQYNNVDELVPNSVGISKNPNLTRTKCSEKQPRKNVQGHTIYAEVEGFQCDSCHIKLNNNRKLKFHLNKYHNSSLTRHDTDYRCRICKYITFCSFNTLRRHMKQKHNVIYFLKKMENSTDKQAKDLEISQKESFSSTENRNPEIINKNIECLNSPSPGIVYSSYQKNLLDPPTRDAKVVINVVDDINIKYNSALKKATDIQSVDPSKSEINVDGKIRCKICKYITFVNLTHLKKHMERIHQFKSILDHTTGVEPFKSEINFDRKIRCVFCKYLTFSNFANFKRHMEAKHHIFNLQNKYNMRKKSKENRNLNAPHQIFTALTTSLEQSNHVKPNVSNNAIINPTENQSILHINPITYVDKAISALIMEDKRNRIQQTNSSEVDKIEFASTIRNNRNIQLQSFNSTTSYPGDDNAEIYAKDTDHIMSSMPDKNTNHLEPSVDAEVVANVVDINEKIYENEKRHQIVNFQSMYKKSKETAASKNYDVKFLPLIRSPQLLVQDSNCTIIKAAENQSVPVTNPISDVDRVTEELLMKDTRITAQQTNYSEANCAATITNNHPKGYDKVVVNVVDNINIKYNSIINKTTDIQSVEPFKGEINFDGIMRCEMCKYSMFSNFANLKRHMKDKHHIINFQNKYKKSKKIKANKDYDAPLKTFQEQSGHTKPNKDAKLVHVINNEITNSTSKFIIEDKSKKLVTSKDYHVQFQPLTTSPQLDHGEPNEDSVLLATDLTINKKCNYNLRRQHHKMDNCVKINKKCETHNIDEPLQQLNASVENSVKKQTLELNTTKKQTTKPKKSFSPDGIDNFIKMTIGNLKCAICERTFCYYSLLNEHFNLKHPNKKCFVNCCGNEVINRWNLVHHLKRHVNKIMSTVYNRSKKRNSIDEEAKMSDIIQTDPLLAITSVISAQPIESVNGTSIDQSSLSSRATSLGKLPIKQCNYCSRTFKYVTSLMKHINYFHSDMRNDFNLNQNTDNRNLSIKSDKGFLNTNLNAEENIKLNEFQEIKTEIPYDILGTRNISVPPLDIVDIKEDINFE